MLGREQQCGPREKRHQCDRTLWKPEQHGRLCNVTRIKLQHREPFWNQRQCRRFGSPSRNARLLSGDEQDAQNVVISGDFPRFRAGFSLPCSPSKISFDAV